MESEDCREASREADYRKEWLAYWSMKPQPSYRHIILPCPVGSITKPRFPSLECEYCKAYSRYDCKIHHAEDCPSGKKTENLLDFLFAKISNSVLFEFVRRYNDYNASN